MKITMYELLGMIKDGKAPKKIKYNDYIYTVKGNAIENFVDYCSEEDDWCFNHYVRYESLNDEVEILEEEKKIPEKLDIRQEKNIKNNWKWKVYGKEHSYNISTPQKIIADKLNETIDYLHYLKSKGDE